MNRHSSRTAQLLAGLLLLSCIVLLNLPKDREKLTEPRLKNKDPAARSFLVNNSAINAATADHRDSEAIRHVLPIEEGIKNVSAAVEQHSTEIVPRPSDEPSAAQEQLKTMLRNLTLDSLEQYYSLEAKSVDAHQSMKVPLTPDPLPVFMAEYAWRDFATNTTLHSTTCPITCQVQVEPAGNNTWSMKTFDIYGRPKTVGGDEFSVLYTEDNKSIDAAARIHDDQDGSYTLEFYKTPDCKDPVKGIGTLKIVLVFSCELGMVSPPTKKMWNTGAFAMTRYDIHNMSAPYMHDFEPANADHAIDLGQYDKILVHGDSTMNHFAGNFVNVKGFPSNLIMWNFDNRHALYVTSVDWVMKKVRDHMAWIVATFGKVAFVFGSSAWDVNIDPDGLHGSDFSNQINASRLLIETMRREFPTVNLYWRSGLAMHPHMSSLNKGKWYSDERNKYMSDGRVQYLYHLQKELMQNLSVTFLDMYPATFVCMDHHETSNVPGDAVHYSAAWNRVMTRWFYPNDTGAY
jgi:hypothetical protein